MKALTVTVPDEVYLRAERRAAIRGATLAQEIVAWVDRYGAEEEDPEIAAAKARMEDLFRTVKGFRMEPKIPREELHERGRLR